MRSRFVLAVALALSALSLDAAAQRRGTGYGGYGGVTVYEHPDFRGDSVTFRNEVADLREHGLNDRISSLEMSGNQPWEVCRDVNYSGGCRVFSGTIDDLRAEGWNDRNDRDSRLVFYDRPNFRGDSRGVLNTAANLGSFGDRARSVQVYGGTWELCDSASRNGRCVTVSQNVSDLRSLGLRGGVTSVREIGRQGRGRWW